MVTLGTSCHDVATTGTVQKNILMKILTKLHFQFKKNANKISKIWMKLKNTPWYLGWYLGTSGNGETKTGAIGQMEKISSLAQFIFQDF